MITEKNKNTKDNKKRSQGKNNNGKAKAKKDKQKKKGKKAKYKVRNWKEYNEALKQRGSLEIWMEEGMIKGWHEKEDSLKKSKKRKAGRKNIYSNKAILLVAQLGKVFKQRLRQTEGLVASLFKIMKINLSIPDFTTLSRRGANLEVKIPKTKKGEKLILIADSSGLKIFGEGEWKVRKHGYSKHRTWRKMHITITPDGEIRAGLLTENNVSDESTVPDLLNQEEEEIEGFAGDGAYDKKRVYDACQEKGVTNFLIPPQKNAKIKQHGNSHLPPHPRDENLRKIRKTSRSKWKENSGYHVRSLVETTMFRYKTIIGDKLNSRKMDNQKTEFLISIGVLNKMLKMGMPDSYKITT